jgi:hypothetical protein
MFILRNYAILTGGSATVTSTASNKQDTKTDIR